MTETIAARHFEDFSPGQIFDCPPRTVTREEILAFAREYDAQPFHVDEEAAKQSFFGGLVASGWHTASLTMRALADRLLINTDGLGSPGIEQLKWLRPVRPGDTISVRATIRECRESRSRPGTGLVRFFIEVFNQKDEAVMSQDNWILIATRDAASRS